MNLNSNQQRKVWIDILKGIGIVTVVAGHIGNLLPPQFGLIRMPLFLFVAGYLFKIHTDRKDYLNKKLVHLIVPYICFLLILYIPQAAMSVAHGHETILEAMTKGILGGQLLVGRAGVFWFITCLFITQQLINYLLTIYSEKTVGIVMVCLLLLSFISSELLPDLWLPWSLNSVFAAAPIFYTGYLFKKHPLNFKGFQYILLIGVIIISLNVPNNVYNMKSNNFGIPFVTFVSALIAVISLIPIAQWLVRSTVAATAFSTISKSSMIMMYLHQPVQFLLKDLFPNYNALILLIAVFVICLGTYFILKKSTYARGLLLGSFNDYKLITTGKLKHQTVTSSPQVGS
jgi:fucose 4-O-acetylase-like acetyltransferase